MKSNFSNMSKRTLTRSIGFAFASATALMAMQVVSAAQWVEVSKQDRIVTVNASGLVSSEDVSEIGVPPTSSWGLRIQSIVEEGARVDEGDVVLRFQTSQQDENLRDRTRQLEVRTAEIEALKEKTVQDLEQEKLDLARLEADAIKAKRKAELPAEVVPGVEYAKLVEQERLARTLYERALKRKELSDLARDLQLTSLEKKVARLQGQIEERQREMSKFTIRSPRDGLALVGTDWQGDKLEMDSRVGPGRFVVQIVDDSKLIVKADVPEHAAAKLAVGQKAIVTSESLGGAELKGTIVSVGSTVRQKSQFSPAMVRDFIVKFDEDYSSVLKLGVSVQVTVQVETLRDSVAVPHEALVYRSGLPGVITGGTWKQVELGSRTEDEIVVLEGLEEGERVRL